jgi:hypothetical protein
MPNFLVTNEVLNYVADIWVRKGEEPYEEIVEVFPAHSDVAYAFAIGIAISSALALFSNARARETLVGRGR